MSAIDELIKDANSILDTLEKDYEAMQSQKSGVRQDQVNKFNDLCDNMHAVLEQYSKTIYDFTGKAGRSFDTDGTEVTIYEYPDECKILVMTPELYWTGVSPYRPTFLIKLCVKSKDGKHTYNSESLAISETAIEINSTGFNAEKGYADIVSIFLNHYTTYEQLDVAFQSALTNFIKICVTYIQERNEKLADKIKTIMS